MRKVKYFLIAFFAIIAFSSCENSSLKELSQEISSILKDELDIDLSDIISIPESENSISSSVDLNGIEIPAPLSDRPEQLLKKQVYSVSYNKDLKLPNWVAWHLTGDMTRGSAKRPNKAFHEDESVPEPRATDWDYYGSGYDRGHMCPAADNRFSDEAMYESFLFTNMCPQTHKLNAGDWEELENACRKWAREYGDIYIVCGPLLYNNTHKTIGKNKVVVPEAFFKVVLCLNGTPRAIGFIYKNNDDDKPMGDYVNTVDEVERLTGIDFFAELPDVIENAVEATSNLNDWKF